MKRWMDRGHTWETLYPWTYIHVYDRQKTAILYLLISELIISKLLLIFYLLAIDNLIYHLLSKTSQNICNTESLILQIFFTLIGRAEPIYYLFSLTRNRSQICKISIIIQELYMAITIHDGLSLTRNFISRMPS